MRIRYSSNPNVFNLLMILPILFVGTFTPAQTWIHTRIVENTNNNGAPWVTVSPLGHFMIAYPEGTAGPTASDFRIYSVTGTTGMDWSSRMTIRDVPGINTFCSARFLSNGLSVVAWQRQRPDSEAYDIWMAREEAPGGTWNTEQVTDDYQDDKRSIIATLSTDDVVIVWPRHDRVHGSGGDKEIAVGKYNLLTEEWDIELLTNNEVNDHRGDVAVDGYDHLHIAYASWTGATGKGDPTQPYWDLFYITGQPGGPWSVPINLSNSLGLNHKADWPSIGITPDGAVHILCAVGDSATLEEDREIYHLTNETGIWTSERITDHVAPCERPALAVGSDGSLHVAYQVGKIAQQEGSIPTRIWYVYRRPGEAWEAPSPVSEDIYEQSEDATISINADGRVVIAYIVRFTSPGRRQVFSATYEYEPLLSVDNWEAY